MIKLSNILNEMELDPGGIDLSSFEELSEKEVKEVENFIRNSIFEKVYSEDRLQMYYSDTMRSIANPSYEIIFRDGDSLFSRELIVYDLPNIEDDNEKVEEIRRIDMEVYKNKPLPDSFYLAAINHKEEHFG